MLLVTGTVRLQSEAHEAVIAAARPAVAAALAEPGCHAYGFAFDLGDPDLVHVHEEWEDAEALRSHLETPHVAAFTAALGPLVASPPQLTRWVDAEAGRASPTEPSSWVGEAPAGVPVAGPVRIR